MQETEIKEPKALSELLPESPVQLPTSIYDDIELTETEIHRALTHAKMLKSRVLDQQADEERRRLVREQMKRPWTAEELRSEIKGRIHDLPYRFEVDDNNRQVLELLTLYYSGDARFEDHGLSLPDGSFSNYSLNKGIMLQSAIRGTGKTELMGLFQNNKRHCFVLVSTKKISSFFEADGDRIIERFSVPWVCEKTPQNYYQSPIGICFDDIGDEEIKSHYGNKENVMQRIISRIYDETHDKTIFRFFHCTTNLTGAEIQEKYNTRVRSRMREMFNFIELPGNDRRK